MATKQSNKKAEKKGEKKTTSTARSAPKTPVRAKSEPQLSAGAAASAKPAGGEGAASRTAPVEGTNSPAPAGAPTAGTSGAPAALRPPTRAKPATDAAPAPTATHPKEQGAMASTQDPRLPPPGTLLQKRDRHGVVRCECTVEKEGIRYAGKVYRSFSAAAMAAAKDLGLGGKTQNGFTFWGLSKPPRPEKDRLAALERAWERYMGSAESLVKAGAGEESQGKVLAAMRKHADTLAHLVSKAA